MGSVIDAEPRLWNHEPIAIVGMSAKYGGDATTTSRLWRMLVEKRNAWSPFPESRFQAEGVYHPDSQRLNSTHVKGAHFLSENVGLFDAAFFGYSGETAASMDPQYRLQLESVYEALENAGLPLNKIAGSNTSVFTGVFVHDYRDGLLRDADNLPRLMATGTGVPMMANRVSHFFDFRGASVTIETACSSGMVAVHQAVQTLRTREADMSVVGGANLTLNPDMFKALGSAGFLSADGKCYAFDSRASGYGRGEGIATLILKRLTDARNDGDPIRAVIRESMVNQDGKTETITSPSLEAQERLVRGCYQKAGLDPSETQYFEAHGTGTQSGDTIEAQGIAMVFAGRKNALPIGSVKTNIGHTEAASGLASIVKTVLAMEKGVIPPSINFEKVNPRLKLEEWNLRVVQDVEPWPSAPIRRASINNFGYGGTNSHIILEDGASWVKVAFGDKLPLQVVNENCDARAAKSAPVILVLSGKDEQACQRIVASLATYIERMPKPHNLVEFTQNLTYTLSQRRTRFQWVAAHHIQPSEGCEGIVRALQSPKFTPFRSARRPRIGMVFTGQGAQWHAMGKELIEAYPVFKEALLEAQMYLEHFGADWSLIDELKRNAEGTRVNEVALSTPICVAVQIALVRLLRAWGIVPVAVTSHSSGEIAAAHAFGALTYKSAMAFAYYRALFASDKSLRLPIPGGMIAIGLSQEETESYLGRLKPEHQAVVACINSPSNTTVSGDLSAVVELEEMAVMDGVFARRLRVDTAWHSHHMKPIVDAYCDTLERTRSEKSLSDASEPMSFSSPVSGGRITDPKVIARPEHWAESMMQPVQFVNAFVDMALGKSGIAASNVDVIVEIGPHTALGGPIQQIMGLSQFDGVNIAYYGTLVRNSDACDSMQLLACSLLKEGYPVDLDAVNFPFGRGQHLSVLTGLPSYPWNHQVIHWVEPRQNRALRARSQPPHYLLGSLVEGGNPRAPAWRQILRVPELPWTKDHAIQNNVVFPAAGYICMAIDAVQQHLALIRKSVGDIHSYRLLDVDFLQALMIPDNSDGIEVQISLSSTNLKNTSLLNEWTNFEVWSVATDNRWTQHAKGLIAVQSEDSLIHDVQLATAAETTHTRRILPADLFANLRTLGIQHGPLFRNMRSIVQYGSRHQSIVEMTVPDVFITEDIPRDHVLHPVTLDSIITAPYSALPGAATRESAAKIPKAVKSLWVASKIGHSFGNRLLVDSTLLSNSDRDMTADVAVSDSDTGETVLEIKELSYQSLGAAMSFDQSRPWMNELCTKVHWSIDISIPLPATLDLVKKELVTSIANGEKSQIDPRTTVAVHLAGIARHYLHKNPRARILEIDAGQDAVAPYILEALGDDASGSLNASSYNLTNSAGTSFDETREALLEWADILSFDELDIQKDPATQGFALGTYDIVIATGIECFLEQTSQAFGHTYSLLRPGGALLLGKSTGMSENDWEAQLQTAGFIKVNATAAHGGKLDDFDSVTIFSTSKVTPDPAVTVTSEEIIIVTSQHTSAPAEWLRKLQDEVVAITGCDGRCAPNVQQLESPNSIAASYAGKICIFLGEAEDTLLYNLDSALMDGIRAMSSHSRGVIWVTRGGAVDCTRPEMSLAIGFVRALRTEFIGRKFVTLDIDPKGAAWAETSVTTIGEILRVTVKKSLDGLEEFEYAERDGVILIPRIRHDVERNIFFSSKTSTVFDEKQVSTEPYRQPHRPLSLQPRHLIFADDEAADSRLEYLSTTSLELEPAVYHSTLNATTELITSPAAAGIITRVGEVAAIEGYSVGDRVVCIPQYTSFSSRAIADWKFAAHIPSDLSFQEAASLPTAFLVPYYALIHMAHLERDQSILIHTASGDVGRASVMLAQYIGADVYAITGTPSVRDWLISSCGLPAEHIFSYATSSCCAGVSSTDHGREFDVLLNLLEGVLPQESLSLVAPLGHLVNISPHKKPATTHLTTSRLIYGGSVTNVDITAIMEHRPIDIKNALHQLVILLESKAVSPIQPVSTLDIGHIAQASTALRENKNGSVALSVNENSTVPVLPLKATAKLSPEASYLIVGGSGGLAQSTARWMVERGAKNLILVSRSAGTSGGVAALITELIGAGCRRVLPISCDIVKGEDLNRAIETCADAALPPIRGVVHAAFVLRDALVQNMTVEDWKYTVESKVAGTRNLHDQFNLHGDLDFFVLFSSVNGVLGYASQAAYSAAGAFQDAFCHWRVNHCNLPAVSIDLSVVNSVGYVAEAGASESLRNLLLKSGRRAIEEYHVLTALESAILAPFEPQFIVGGINTGPGEHWNTDGDLGRDMRLLPLKYNPLLTESNQHQSLETSKSLAARISTCLSRADAILVVEGAIAEMIADIFLIPVEDVDLSQTPAQQGVDSLVAVEVRKLLFTQAGAELSIFNILQSPSLSQLAADVVKESVHVKRLSA